MPPTPGGRPAVPSLYQCRSIAGRYSTSRSPATAFRWSGRDLLAFSPRAVTHEPKGPGPGLSAAFAMAFACAIPGSWCGSGRRAYRTPPRSPTSRSRRGVTVDSQGTYMRFEPEISGVSVVLVGKFNPAIFTPAWFALHGLLPAAVAENAELQVAHQHITAFSADWLRFEVTLEVCKFETLQAPHIRVADLAVRTFREYLSHTPLTAVGINRDVHFRVREEAERDRIGQTLVPVAPWGRWRDELELDGFHGGMTSVTMSQLRPAERPDGGRINIKVEPSHRIREEGLGRIRQCQRPLRCRPQEPGR